MKKKSWHSSQKMYYYNYSGVILNNTLVFFKMGADDIAQLLELREHLQTGQTLWPCLGEHAKPKRWLSGWNHWFLIIKFKRAGSVKENRNEKPINTVVIQQNQFTQCNVARFLACEHVLTKLGYQVISWCVALTATHGSSSVSPSCQAAPLNASRDILEIRSGVASS